ncbi:MAG: nickel-dependent hydrogenase large subunit [Neptuniibacter sp.]
MKQRANPVNLSELSGQLNIKIKWREGVVEQVDLTSSRPQRVTCLFNGKLLLDLLNLIPMLYSLCGIAQKVAALRAAESALDIKASPEVDQGRNLLVQAETARELGLRLFTDWYPDGRGVKAELMKWFAGVKDEYDWALQLNLASSRSLNPADVADKLHAILEPVLSMKPDSGTTENAEDDIWESSVLQSLKPELESFFSRSQLVELKRGCPELEIVDRTVQHKIAESLKSSKAYQFCAAPEVNGEKFESSVYTLSLRFNKLKNKEFNGGVKALLFRLNALECMLRSMPEQIKSGSGNSMIYSDVTGMGIVQAARGVLIHHMELDGHSVSDSVITDYKIVAPTEWNFHPQGTFVKMLEGSRVNLEQLPILVESLIRLIDPCVGWQLELDT